MARRLPAALPVRHALVLLALAPLAAACSHDGAPPRSARSGACEAAIWAGRPPPWIVGHRGSGNVVAPENTLPAFAAALQAGVGIETDLRTTRDGRIALIHDHTTDRTTGVSGLVSDFDYSELTALGAGLPFHPELFPDAHVPGLDALLALAGGRVPLLLELKSVDGPPFLAALEADGWCDGVVVQSFELPQLMTLGGLRSGLRLMWISTDPEATALDRIPVPTHGGGLWGVAVRTDVLTQSYVNALHARGLRVFAWLVNEVGLAERLLGWGVEGLVSDDPAYLARLTGRVSAPSEVAPAPKFLGSGWRLHRRSGGKATVRDGCATWDEVPIQYATSLSVVSPGLRTPVGAWAVETTVRIDGMSGAANDRLGFRIGLAGDEDDGTSPYAGPAPWSGVYLEVSAAGRASVQRVLMGQPTELATADWSRLPAGPFRVRLETTGTGGLAATRLDTGERVEANLGETGTTGFFSVYGVGVLPCVGATGLYYESAPR